MTTIIYHDLASEYYLAYVLDGLMSKAASFQCKIRISKREPCLLQHIDLPAKDVNRMFALGIFEISTGNTTKWFCIDAHDDSSPEGYFRPILEKVDYYFKLNRNPKAFEEDAGLARLDAKNSFPRLRLCPATIKCIPVLPEAKTEQSIRLGLVFHQKASACPSAESKHAMVSNTAGNTTR